MVKRIFKYFVGAVGVFLALAAVTSTPARAGIVENAYLSISDPSASSTSNHTFNMEWPATGDLGAIDIDYCVEPSGGCSDVGPDPCAASEDLSSITIAGGSNEYATWDAYSACSDPSFDLKRDSASSNVAAGSTINIVLNNMTNPAYASCTHNQPTNSSTGTCYVQMTFYSDTGATTSVHTGIVSITVTRDVTVTARVDPTFTLTVEGIAGTAQTVNGSILTNNLTTTITTIPFGNLTADTAKNASHKLTVTGNNSGGYTVTAKMDANLTGAAYGDDIDPFTSTGDDADEDTPQTWTNPDGATSGTDTGWLGVGTDDTGVTNQASNQFFSLGTTGTVVAKTSAPASARVSNVVYRIQVNAYQQADSYQGTLTYNALPTY